MEKFCIEMAKALGIDHLNLPDDVYPRHATRTLVKSQLKIAGGDLFFHPTVYQIGEVDWDASPLAREFRDEDVPKILKHVFCQLVEKAAEMKKKLCSLEQRDRKLNEVEKSISFLLSIVKGEN